MNKANTRPLLDWMSAHPRSVLQITGSQPKGFIAELMDVTNAGATRAFSGTGLDPQTAMQDLETDIRSKTEPHFRTNRNGDM